MFKLLVRTHTLTAQWNELVVVDDHMDLRLTTTLQLLAMDDDGVLTDDTLSVVHLLIEGVMACADNGSVGQWFYDTQDAVIRDGRTADTDPNVATALVSVFSVKEQGQHAVCAGEPCAGPQIARSCW